jgi:DMSO reductase family type II enzyme chaperone
MGRTTSEEPVLAAEAASARAVLYRLAAQAFRHPDESWRPAWDEIAAGVGAALAALPASRARTELADAFDLAWAASCDSSRVREDHARLIGHSPRAGATPYETEWTGAAGELLQYHLLADLAGFYRAFGLELAQGCDERADHLSIELCFMQFLCLKEAAAEEGGLADLAACARAGEKRFLEEHLLRWAPGCCARFVREDERSFLGRAAALVASFLALEAERFAVEPGQGELRTLAESSLSIEDCCIGCSQASSCLGRAPEAGEHGGP